MWRALLGIALALSVLAACGGGPATPTPSGEGVTPTSNLPATATRQAELAELATVRALADKIDHDWQNPKAYSADDGSAIDW